MKTELKVGQKVNVKFRYGIGTAIQSGTITEILPDGRFKWNNGYAVIRTATAEQITSEPVRQGKLNPYVQKWVDDEANGGEE